MCCGSPFAMGPPQSIVSSPEPVVFQAANKERLGGLSLGVAETEQAIREAIAFHLEGLREDGSPIPPASSQVEYVEVAA
jgi:hypothetical protein